MTFPLKKRFSVVPAKTVSIKALKDIRRAKLMR